MRANLNIALNIILIALAFAWTWLNGDMGEVTYPGDK